MIGENSVSIEPRIYLHGLYQSVNESNKCGADVGIIRYLPMF